MDHPGALYNDPYLYVNYAAAAMAIYLIWKYSPIISKIRPPVKALLSLLLLALAVWILTYISWDAGSQSLRKLGIEP